MDHNSYTIFFLGLTVDQEVSLWEKVLNSADILGRKFSKGLPAYSNLFFVSLDSSFSSLMLKRAKNDNSIRIIFVSTNNDLPSDFQSFDFFHLDASDEILIDLLSKCIQEDNALVLEKNLQEINSIKEGDCFAFSSIEELSKSILLAFKTPFAASITKDSTSVLIDLREKIFYINKDEIAGQAITHQNCILKILDKFKQGGELQFILPPQLCDNTAEQFITMDLDIFLWSLGEQNEEHLLVNASENAMFIATFWPDFGLIKLNSNLLRIYARLIKQALSISMIMASFNIQKTECIKFLNGLALCQYLIWDADGSEIEFSYEDNQTSSLTLNEISLLRNDLSI